MYVWRGIVPWKYECSTGGWRPVRLVWDWMYPDTIIVQHLDRSTRSYRSGKIWQWNWWLTILCSFHWLRKMEHIEYKLFSPSYKVLTTTKPPYLQPPRRTHCSLLVTLVRPPTSSSLRITDYCFWYASPCLWNQLPPSLRLPHSTSDSAFSLSTSIIPLHLLHVLFHHP